MKGGSGEFSEWTCEGRPKAFAVSTKKHLLVHRKVLIDRTERQLQVVSDGTRPLKREAYVSMP